MTQALQTDLQTNAAPSHDARKLPAVAVLTALVVDVVARDGARETFRLRLTQTWINAVDGWQCLSGHAGPRLD